jgi:hypothetical protein
MDDIRRLLISCTPRCIQVISASVSEEWAANAPPLNAMGWLAMKLFLVDKKEHHCINVVSE